MSGRSRLQLERLPLSARLLGTATAIVLPAWFALPSPSARAAPDAIELPPAAQVPDPSKRVVPSFTDVLGLTSPLTQRVHFAATTFDMGSDRNEMALALADCAKEVHGQLCEASHFSNEGPQRRVTVSAFRLDRYEVSVEDYQRCVQAQRCQPLPYYREPLRWSQPRQPVNMVSWYDARDYCHFVDAELPTEAQWERAARGPSQRRYPWGNFYNPRRSNHGRLAWDETYAQDGYRELAPVGSYPSGATPQGVFDLAGNVEEWVLDRYDVEYDPQDTQDPLGAQTANGDPTKSVRGGSYTSPAVRLRCASRTGQMPETRDPTRGFRCAQNLGAFPRVGSD